MYVGLDLGTSGLKGVLIDEGQRLVAEAAGDDRQEVTDEQVFEGEEPVQRPHVQVLGPVPRVPWLGGSQSCERVELDVGVEADDVGVGMVQRIVLCPPEP